MATEATTLPMWRTLAESDPEIAQAIQQELHRQNDGLELIASENFVSRAVLEAAGSVMTNKYAEGLPGPPLLRWLRVRRRRRAHRDRARDQPVRRRSRQRAAALGRAGQLAVYMTLLKPGDTVLGMNLAHGGHLTHGHPLNFSGQLYTIVPYGVRQDDERIDYDELGRLADERRPKMILVGASAYPRVIDFARIRAVADRVGAALFTDMAHIAGLVAAGIHPSPVPHSDFVSTTTHKTLRGPRGGMVLCRQQYAKDLDRTVFPGVQGGPLMHIIAAKAVCFKEALEPSFAVYQRQIVANASRLAAGLSASGFRLVSGGTDNHLMLVDVFSKGITGKVAEAALGKAGITVNKNAIPFDQNPPMVASGIRIGTPAVTSRGMREAEMDLVADLITRALKTPDDDARARSGARPKSRGCAGSSRCIPKRRPDRPGRPGKNVRPAGLTGRCGVRSRRPARARLPQLRASCRPGDHGRGRRSGVRGWRRGPRRSGDRHRQNARVSDSRDSEPTARADLDRHEKPSGADLLQGHPRGPRGARDNSQRDLHERPRELPLPASTRADHRGGRPLAGASCFHSDHPEWAARTETGDRAELEDLPEDLSIWSDVSATADTCLGSECPRYDECFVTRMRQRAAESDIVIVNHHLLCADASVRQSAFGEVIPACHLAVVDEAHQLEDVATQYFGFSLSNYRIDDLARDVERLAASSAVESRSERDAIARAVERLRDDSRTFFTELAFAHRSTDRSRGEERVRASAASLDAVSEAAIYLTGALDVVESTLSQLPKRSGAERRRRRHRRFG